MTDNESRPPKDQDNYDPEVAKELEGVPEELLEEEQALDSIDDALGKLQDELEAAKQDMLYARAEAQNVRRRLEKDIADAHAYAVTGFARDILSVYDNLSRALSAIPAELREDDKLSGLVAGIEATAREIDKVFAQHGISRIASMGLPLDPNQHQAMLEIPSGEHEPGTIIQEMQAGYMIKERLLRPAMVGVAKKPD